MTRSPIRSSVVVALLAMLFIALAPLSVLAQRGGGGGGGARGGGAGSAGQARPAGPGPGSGGGRATVRPGPGGPGANHVVVAGGYPYRYGYGYGYPYHYCCGYPYGWYSPWFGYGGWGWNFGFSYGWGYPYPYAYAGYPYAFGYPYGPYGYGYPYSGYGFYGGASLKLEVTPKTAEVFVDGYRAGIVDDFDGTFQHLEVPPGEHELVLYSDGYRTVQQKLFMSASSNQRVKYALEKLAPGETSGPRPTPPPEPTPEQQQPQQQQQQLPPRRPQPQGPPPPDPAQAPESFGMISIRTQPVDAEILVDGETWERSTGTSRLVIQLAPGRHRVEVRKAGFTTYSEEVLIRAGATMTLNVSLLHGEER